MYNKICGCNSSRWLNNYKQAIDINIITSITDSQGKIVFINDKFCEVSGYSKSELIGYSHNIINSGYHPHEFFQELWSTIKSNKPWRGEIRNKTKDGSFYWVDTVIIPVKTEMETQYLSLRTVITEKKELQIKQIEYITSIEKMLFMTSHNLRAPITSIMGLTNLNKIDMPEKELLKVQNYLKNSINDLDKFTKELTEYIYKLKEVIK